MLEVDIRAYKRVGRVLLPSKRVVRFNGKTILEDEVVRYRLGQVDASKFAKPKPR